MADRKLTYGQVSILQEIFRNDPGWTGQEYRRRDQWVRTLRALESRGLVEVNWLHERARRAQS
jgi:hypothetical protein